MIAKTYRIGLMIVLLTCFISLTHAQIVDVPLVAQISDSLYRLEGDTLVAYPECTPPDRLNGQLIPAPVGGGLLMMTMPPRVDEVIREQGGIGGGPLPNQIWLCDRITNTLTPIATQPDDFSFFEGGDVPDFFRIFSKPAWSPDGNFIAISLLDNDSQYSVEIYEVATGTIVNRIDIPDELYSYGIPSPASIEWGRTGLITYAVDMDEVTFIFSDLILVYDPVTGLEISRQMFNTFAEDAPILDTRFIAQDEQGNEFLALIYREGPPIAFDMLTGETRPIENAFPALVSAVAPSAGALVADFQNPFLVTWQIQTANFKSPLLSDYPVRRMAISADGTRFAYADSIVWVSLGNVIQPIQASDGVADDYSVMLAWAGAIWRFETGNPFVVEAVVTPTPMVSSTPIPFVCAGTQPSRLSTGMTARVTSSTTPNRIRENPGLGFRMLGQIPPGGEFTVLSAPTCADGYAWYQVNYEGIIGWTAEGSSDTYWLEEQP